MTKIYTRTGDAGETGLADGRRVAKNAARMELNGALDELNSLLGLARSHGPGEAIDAVLHRLQSDLFAIGAEVAGSPANRAANEGLSDTHVKNLEQEIDRFEAELQPLTRFILPGGCPAAATLHLARAVCRRAERRLVGLLQEEPEAIRPTTLAYMNRLSDLLFVLARAANAQARIDETNWEPE
jgi:cob(I)alamin adenosyltransferase